MIFNSYVYRRISYKKFSLSSTLDYCELGSDTKNRGCDKLRETTAFTMCKQYRNYSYGKIGIKQ